MTTKSIENENGTRHTDRMLDLRAHPQPLLTDVSETVSGVDLFARIEPLNKKFAGPGLVVLSASASIDFVAAFLTLLQLQRPVAILNGDWTENETQKALQTLGEYSMADDQGNLKTLQRGGPHVLHPETAVILFTSGSMGQPRPVQLSKKNIQANLRAVASSLDFTAASEQVLFLPLSYSFGLLGQLLPALSLGVRTILLKGFAEAPRWIAANGMRGMWSAVPSHWAVLMRFLKSQPQLLIEPSHIISAGGRLGVELRERMRELFPQARLFNNYGLTEASPRILCLRGDSPFFVSEAVGYPVGDWQLKLSTEGELLASGRQVMLGYIQNSDRVKEGWLHTGDMARIESDGLVYIEGRADQLVKIAGERISLVEIETALAGLPGIHAACILTHPHPIYGLALEAFLECESSLTLNDILGKLKALLSIHKIPQTFYRLEALPLNKNGKVDRRGLEDLRSRAQRLT